MSTEYITVTVEYKNAEGSASYRRVAYDTPFEDLDSDLSRWSDGGWLILENNHTGEQFMVPGDRVVSMHIEPCDNPPHPEEADDAEDL